MPRSRSAEHRRRRIAFLTARQVGHPFTLARAARLARIAQALSIPLPQREAPRRLTPGPLATALAPSITAVLVNDVLGLPAYTARVCRELVAGW